MRVIFFIDGHPFFPGYAVHNLYTVKIIHHNKKEGGCYVNKDLDKNR